MPPMNAQPPAPLDPTDLAAVNAAALTWAEPGEQIDPVACRHIVIAPDGLEALADLTASLAGSGPVLLVADRTAIRRGREPLKPMVAAALARRCRVTSVTLSEENEPEYHPGPADAAALADQLGGFAALVSVGAGSVTDVAKYARTLAEQGSNRRIPFICFPTAASVTAYTSAIAVLLHDGCKRNFAAEVPDAIVCDLPTLASAPPLMTAAGFADVLARSVAYGDWYLAKLLGMDDRFSAVPDRLLKPSEQLMIDEAGAIASGSPDGVRTLIEALLLAGMCMSVIRHTAPISGWEHVISHYLDMTAHADGRRMALHGGQVGVGTLIAARAYARDWRELDADRLVSADTDGEREAELGQAGKLFDRIDPSGRTSAEIRRELEAKWSLWQRGLSRRQRFADGYRRGEWDAPLRRWIRPLEEIERALVAVNAPRTFEGLDQSVSTDSGIMAVRFGHLVRSRFTLGDLLARAGRLGGDDAARLVQMSS